MKTKLIIPVFIVLSFCACSNSTNDEKLDIPKALDNQSSTEILTKSRNDDMIENLYAELVDKTPELKDIETEIENIQKGKPDSVNPYRDFNNKNAEYFSSANNNAEKISDSLLKIKIKTFILNSQSAYNLKISKHEALLAAIDTKVLSLSDLHTFLKIAKTIPVIEKYQDENMPRTKPLEGLLKQLDRTTKKIDSIIEK